VSHPAAAAPATEPTILLNSGWHCLHLFYRVNQAALNAIPEHKREAARDELSNLLNPQREGAPQRVQTSVVSGHRADLAILVMDPNPLVLDSIKTGIRTSTLGLALEPTYSFVSITEISEYVPSLQQYGERLALEGFDPQSPSFAARMKAYEGREVAMTKQRLYPDFPAWPVTCFYPMNKIRDPHANWYAQPFSRRYDLMAEHGKSGMKFAGKASQVITASTGLDDWEWGVTLWGREPAFLKEIVYTMRFDEASALYAEFGPFYVSYIMSPMEALKQIQV